MLVTFWTLMDKFWTMLALWESVMWYGRKSPILQSLKMLDMSKKKLLIREVFDKGRMESGKEAKSAIAFFLSLHLEEVFKFLITDKTLVRYYDAYILKNNEINIDRQILNKLSQYVGYKDFLDFSRTFVKKEENVNKTTIKISVDEDEESISENFSKLNINITNEQHFRMPDFMKQNGLGILEITFLICIVTGNLLFSNNKRISYSQVSPLGFMSNVTPMVEKRYMYWNGERYIGTDSNYISPGIDIIAMNAHKVLYFKKIMRKDTLTDLNALGKVWYSKYNNEVDFFTDDGINPDNGRELRKATSFIIYKYAGKQKDSMIFEEE